ncbi:MAG: hypothetical protein NVSMB27_20930 [Ktedonobacteraceae bacterium]
MRILHVNDLNEVAKIYANQLGQRGHTVTVYEPSLRGGFAPLPIKLAMLPGRLINLSSVVDKLQPGKYDIMHIHWASYGVLGLASRIPYVIHCHGSDVRHRLQQGMLKPILTSLLRRADAVLCITPDLLPCVRAVRADALFSPAPINVEQFTPGEGHLQSERWTILLFARLDPEKGTDIAAQGIARFIQRHPEVQVKLIDWGPQKEQYKQAYQQYFTFIPRVAPGLVRHLLCSADVVVGQLACGALGLSELQAMSCAKPLIASFLYNNAYPAPPPLLHATTAQEVEMYLENLFQNPEAARELGLRARTWIVDNHNCQTLATRLELTYQSVLRTHYAKKMEHTK